MTTSFFNGESTFPENNTTDQLVDALTVQLNITDAASQAAQAAATLAASSAANAAISETNVAGLSQQANDTLAQANTTLAAANAAIAATAASATAAAGSATAAAASATSAGTAAGQASVSETNASASQVAAAASQADALVSKNSATASASAALASKNAAATSETNAGTSATSATSSKNAAATSASNAATSETNANTSKNAAATSATNAATSEGNAATSATAAAASALVAQNFTASLSGRNRIINGNFPINQRGYVSGTATTVANQYTLDRWRVVVSGQSITFAASGNGKLVTAPAGGLEQVIEGNNIEGGTFVLNWTGTATATLNGASISKGATATLTANTNATLRFTGGTVGLVQLEAGSLVTPFEWRPYGQELALCQRYYEKLGGEVQYDILFQGYGFGTGTVSFTVPYKVTKRASATVTKVGTWAVSNATQPTVVTSSGTSGVPLNTTVSSTGQVQVNTVDATTYITASAEL